MYISNGVGRKSVAVVEFSKDTLSYEMQKTDSKWTDESEHLIFGKFKVSKKSDEIYIKCCDIPLIHLYAEPIDQSVDYAKKLIQKRISHYKEDPLAKQLNDEAITKIFNESTNYSMLKRIVKHYSGSVKLPITQYNGSPFNFEGIICGDYLTQIYGFAGGPYAAESTNIDVSENNISVYDTKHHIDHTRFYNKDLIRDFVKFFKENIDIDYYLSEPTNTGMVMLSSTDTDKLRQWAISHKFNESINSKFVFDKVLNEAWNHHSGYVPHDGNGMVGGRWASSDTSGEYEKEIEVELDGTYYLVYLTMNADLDQGYDDSVNYSWSDVNIDENSIQLKDMMRELSDEQDVTYPELRNKLFNLAKEKLLANPDKYFENDFEIDESDYN